MEEFAELLLALFEAGEARGAAAATAAADLAAPTAVTGMGAVLPALFLLALVAADRPTMYDPIDRPVPVTRYVRELQRDKLRAINGAPIMDGEKALIHRTGNKTTSMFQ